MGFSAVGRLLKRGRRFYSRVETKWGSYRGVGRGGGGGGRRGNFIHFLYKVLGQRSVQK